MATHFGSTTTADEVLSRIDLHDRIFLLTGTSSGVGAETARALVAQGAAVVGVVRNAAGAGPVLDDIRAAAERGTGSLDVVEADLSSLASVRACAVFSPRAERDSTPTAPRRAGNRWC